MKTGFFRALYGTCCGLTIFERLQEQSLWRALCHLLLMSILASVVITAGVYPGLRDLVNRSTDIITENCGSIVIAPEGITPEKSPETARCFMVSGPVSIAYLPENAAALPKDFRQECHTGVIWSAKRIVFWIWSGGDTFQLIPLTASMNGLSALKCASSEELFKSFQAAPALAVNGTDVLDPVQLRALGELFLMLGWSGWVLRITLLEVLIYIAMFSGVFVLMNLGRPRRWKLRQVVVMAIYAGFPAMVIGAMAEALQLPYLNFNIIYSMGMMIYLIMAMNRLERLRQEREWRQSSKN